MEKRDRFQNLISEREMAKRALLQGRWSRREEADFYRVVATYGVERDTQTGNYKWATFRSLAKLDKKFDETLTEYYEAFYHMCMTVTKRYSSAEERESTVSF